ncbi:hypothetical protein ACM6O8_16920, partial [Klebsiella pneumoniae]
TNANVLKVNLTDDKSRATQLARIAAWLTPQTIPGLDTLSLMGAQLVRPWPESTLPVLNIDALEPLL